MIVFGKDYYYGNNFSQHVADAFNHQLTKNMAEKFETAVRHPNFAYTRFRPNVGVTAYHRNPTSPTGVLAAASVRTLEDAREILDKVGRAFPLSPTEGLNKSGAGREY